MGCSNCNWCAACGSVYQEDVSELESENSELRERVKALEAFLEMVIDPRKMPHQHSNLETRLACLAERANELSNQSKE